MLEQQQREWPDPADRVQFDDHEDVESDYIYRWPAYAHPSQFPAEEEAASLPPSRPPQQPPQQDCRKRLTYDSSSTTVFSNKQHKKQFPPACPPLPLLGLATSAESSCKLVAEQFCHETF